MLNGEGFESFIDKELFENDFPQFKVNRNCEFKHHNIRNISADTEMNGRS